MGDLARESTPAPADTLCGEDNSVAYWLASAWPLGDIADEWDWLFEDKPPAERLGEVWLRPRWTTAAELADEDALYDLFGDVEMSGVSTDVVYDLAKPESPGAHRYLSTEYEPRNG